VENKVIYLDNNATTPVDPRVVEAMLPFFRENFANANSVHQAGLKVKEAIENARSAVAELIGADPRELIFTSGATESINLAIQGIAESYQKKGNHIITVSTEHSAVLDTCRVLETKGYEVTYLSVDSGGLIDLNELKSTLRNDTILVSIMYVNNETGIIQPINAIAEIVHSTDALFMCDATQAVGKLSIDVQALQVDLMCFSGHKFYGPKGIGALYLRHKKSRINLPALLYGGGHEGGLRSGTLNVPGIVGMGKASSIASLEFYEDMARIRELRDELELNLLGKFPDAIINGDRSQRIFNITNICFPGLDANTLIERIPNVAVSNGSACTAAVFKPSHVLKEMGLNNDQAFASIRFSLGRFNTKDEINYGSDQIISFINTFLRV